jgi:hypothetical protein
METLLKEFHHQHGCSGGLRYTAGPRSLGAHSNRPRQKRKRKSRARGGRRLGEVVSITEWRASVVQRLRINLLSADRTPHLSLTMQATLTWTRFVRTQWIQNHVCMKRRACMSLAQNEGASDACGVCAVD